MASIVFTADENYLRYIPCNFAQLAAFGAKADSVILVVPPALDSRLRFGIESAAEECGLDLTMRFAPELSRFYSGALIDDYWYMSVSKLFLGDLLPDVDDVLYLDVDTMVRGPLDELLDWDLRHPIAGVAELNPGGTHLFGTPRQPYFNAGVLRMSLERMRSEQVGDRARDLLTRYVLTLQDQDVYNLLFAGRFDLLPQTFNVFDIYAQAYRGLAALHDPVIVHFAGSGKPWEQGSKSRFARDWRRLYSHAVIEPESTPDADTGARVPPPSAHGHQRLRRLAEATLPVGLRRGVLSAGLGAVEATQVRLGKIHAMVSPESRPAHALSWGIQFRETMRRSNTGPTQSEGAEPNRRLDLLISLPNSGTDALGEAIQCARPDVRFLPEVFHGVATGLGDEQEFGALDSRITELMEGAAAAGTGRCLIPILPDQLHPRSLCELLAVFRPRLLFLRRPIVFSYLAEESDPGPFAIDGRQASLYAVRCDSWVDGVAELGTNIGLQSVWLTYDGLFATGEDVRLLESFYPGAPISALPGPTGQQTERSDQSVLSIAKAVAGLSPTVQAQFLRLPGA